MNNGKRKNRGGPARLILSERNNRDVLTPERFCRTTRTRPIVPDGVYNNVHFMHAATSLVGNVMRVTTASGVVYEGVFRTFSSNFDVVLEVAAKVDNPDGPNPTLIANSVVDKLIFKSNDILSMVTKDVDLDYAIRDTFQTDTAITARLNGTPKQLEERAEELEPWEPSMGVGIGGVGGGNGTGINGGDGNVPLELENNPNGWDPNDMFRKNEQDYGVQSTYDQSLRGYTVQLQNTDTPDYREAEAKATQIANEIESQAQYKARIELENGDEETVFAAVVRPAQPQSSPQQPPPTPTQQLPPTQPQQPSPLPATSTSSSVVSAVETSNDKYIPRGRKNQNIAKTVRGTPPPSVVNNNNNNNNNNQPSNLLPLKNQTMVYQSSTPTGNQSAPPPPQHLTNNNNVHVPPPQTLNQMHVRQQHTPPHGYQGMQRAGMKPQMNGETKSLSTPPPPPSQQQQPQQQVPPPQPPPSRPVRTVYNSNNNVLPPVYAAQQHQSDHVKNENGGGGGNNVNHHHHHHHQSRHHREDPTAKDLHGFAQDFKLANNEAHDGAAGMQAQPPPPTPTIPNVVPSGKPPQSQSSPPQQSISPQQQSDNGGGGNGVDKVTNTLKKSTLNPNAKEFVWNPTAKPFQPRSPSTPSASRPHTPQTPSHSPYLTAAAVANAVGNAGPQPHMGVMMPMGYMVPSQAQYQPQPQGNRMRKTMPMSQMRTDVAVATGQPLLAPAPIQQFVYPPGINPQGYPQMHTLRMYDTPQIQYLPPNHSNAPSPAQPPPYTTGQGPQPPPQQYHTAAAAAAPPPPQGHHQFPIVCPIIPTQPHMMQSMPYLQQPPPPQHPISVLLPHQHPQAQQHGPAP